MSKTPTVGDNSRLTPEQEQSLFFNCVDRYERALTKKKTEDANLKNECKTIKSDLSNTGFTLDDIKDAIKMRDDGSEEFAERMRKQTKIAAWLALPLGAQASFLDGDPRPAEEKAHEEGHAAGLAAKDCKSPYEGILGQKWIEGWHAGQAIRATEFRAELERNNKLAESSTSAAPKKRGRPRKDSKDAVAEEFDDALEDAAPRDEADLRPPFLVEKTDAKANGSVAPEPAA